MMSFCSYRKLHCEDSRRVIPKEKQVQLGNNAELAVNAEWKWINVSIFLPPLIIYKHVHHYRCFMLRLPRSRVTRIIKVLITINVLHLYKLKTQAEKSSPWKVVDEHEEWRARLMHDLGSCVCIKYLNNLEHYCRLSFSQFRLWNCYCYDFVSFLRHRSESQHSSRLHSFTPKRKVRR